MRLRTRPSASKIEGIGELLDAEGFGLSEAAELLGIAIVMGQAMAGSRNADVGDGAAIGFAADHARDKMVIRQFKASFLLSGTNCKLVAPLTVGVESPTLPGITQQTL